MVLDHVEMHHGVTVPPYAGVDSTLPSLWPAVTKPLSQLDASQTPLSDACNPWLERRSGSYVGPLPNWFGLRKVCGLGR